MNKIISVLIVLLALTLVVMPVHAQIPDEENGAGIYCGATITEDTTLEEGLSCADGSALKIGADDVTLDCNGFTIDAGEGASNGQYGVYASGDYSGVTVQNCNIKGFWSYGIYLSGHDNASILNNNITNNANGIYVNAENNALSGNTITGTVFQTASGEFEATGHSFTTTGISVYGKGEGNTFTGNEVSNQYYGIYTGEGASVSVNGGNYHDNTYGVYANYETSIDLTNGVFVNNTEYGVYDNSEDTIDWTITSDGATCTNNDVTIFGELEGLENLNAENCALTVEGDSVCGGGVACSCGDYLYADRTFTEDDEILECESDYGIYVAEEDVTLDCNGGSITGYTSEGDDYSGTGVYSEYDGFSLLNCEIQYFGTGVYLYESSGHTVEGNTISNNYGDHDDWDTGLHMEYVSDVTVEDNTFENDETGVYASDASNINVLGNTFLNNYNDGIYFSSVSDYVIQGNTITINEENDPTGWEITDEESDSGDYSWGASRERNVVTYIYTNQDMSSGESGEGSGYLTYSYQVNGDAYISVEASGDDCYKYREHGSTEGWNTGELELTDCIGDDSVYLYFYLYGEGSGDGSAYVDDFTLYVDENIEWSDDVESGAGDWNVITYREERGTDGIDIDGGERFREFSATADGKTHRIIRDNVVSDQGYEGIAVDNTEDVLIQNNTVTGTGYNGISLYEVSESEIRDNEVIGSNHYGIRVASNSEGTGGSNLIDGNTLTENENVGLRIGTESNTITNNVIQGTGSQGHGISVHSNWLTPEGNTLRDNEIFDNYYGIYYSKANNGVSGPDAANSGTHAWYSQDDYGSQYTELTRTLDLTSAQSSASFEFYAWYYTEDCCDYGELEVYSSGEGVTAANGVGEWIRLAHFEGSGEGWSDYSYDLSDYIGQELDIRFTYYGDGSVNYVGVYLDDFTLTVDGQTAWTDDGESGEGDWSVFTEEGSEWTLDNLEAETVEQPVDTITSNELYNNQYGLYVSNAPNVVFSENNVHENCVGAYVYDTQDTIVRNTDFTSNTDEFCEEGDFEKNSIGITRDGKFTAQGPSRNAGIGPSGLYVTEAHVDLWNSNFVNNGRWGIYDSSENSVDWTVDETATCTNNNVNIDGGSIRTRDGTLTVTNCNITVEGEEFVVDNGQKDSMKHDLNLENNGSTTLGNGSKDGYEATITVRNGASTRVRVKTYTQNPGGSGFANTALGQYVDVTPQESIDLDWWIIKMYYTDEQVTTAGLDESTLRIQYYNATSETWYTYNPPEGGVNTGENYVWANSTHFSVYGVFGNTITVSGPSTVFTPGSFTYGSTGTTSNAVKEEIEEVVEEPAVVIEEPVAEVVEEPVVEEETTEVTTSGPTGFVGLVQRASGLTAAVGLAILFVFAYSVRDRIPGFASKKKKK